MPLAPRTRLGAFEIIEFVGAGGMGEVYRARDTRLARTVALKILPKDFPHSGGLRERFEREAKSISSLNHPNICVLHDIGTEGGIDFLVLEFLEGEGLDGILKKGPLPVADAIRLGVEIASALDAAHHAGVVHRDLKPGNVIVTKTGAKLLDFGLAKNIRPVLAGVEGETLTQGVTASGTIVGTLQYMAPEQLEGKDADARTDIFACGCVLYEMLTGEKAFPGRNAASIIGAIMSGRTADLAVQQPPIPAPLRRIVATCLAKDPDDRFQTARDLKRALEWSQSAEAPPPPPRRTLLPWAVAIVCAIGAGLAGWALVRGRATAPPLAAARFHFSEPEGAWMQRFITQQSTAIAPSGGRIAMIAADAKGSRIWLRSLDSITATPLAGTEGALFQFWSPDSKSIAFYADGKLKRMAADGGAPVPICDLPGGWSGTWGTNGEMIVAGSRAVTYRIRIDSGAVTPWKRVLWPRFLPDGRHLIYVTIQPQGFLAQVEDLSTGAVTPLASTHTQAIFVPGAQAPRRGYLIFGRDSTLLAQSVDLDRPAASVAVPIAEHVPYFSPTGWSEFDASADGHLVFGVGSPGSNLTWIDRSGHVTPLSNSTRDYWSSARQDRTSSRIAADVYDLARGGTDLWVLDERTGASERITFEPGVEAVPVWSPDGRRIVYGSAQRTAPQLRVLGLGENGTRAEFPPGAFQLPVDWSSDGRWIAYQTSGGDMASEIWFASAGEDRKLYPVIQNPLFNTVGPAFSPDGKYLAFSSNESGRQEVYVQAIEFGPPPRTTGGRVRVSLNGGTVPRWRRDGGELFFLSPDLGVMSSAVQRGTPPKFASPARIVSLPASINTMNPSGVHFDVDATGTRFLVLNRTRPSTDRLQMILNWQALLKP
jgi:hypothetical protein